MQYFLNEVLPYLLIGACIGHVSTFTVMTARAVREEFDRELPFLREWRARRKLERQLGQKWD